MAKKKSTDRTDDKFDWENMTDEETEEALDERHKQRDGRYWREWRSGIAHHNIPTTKRRIIRYCWQSHMGEELQDIIGLGREHPEYMMRLAVFSWQAYFLFQLIYKGQDGMYKKLPAERYAEELFLGLTESPDEIWSAFIPEANRETAFRIYKTVCDALCPMIAHTGSDRFWPSYVAYLVNYIIEQQGDVPTPDVEKMMVPYPHNYPLPWNEEESFFPHVLAI